MANPATILVVDDEALNQRLLQGILRSPDYNIEFASNGEEALRKAAEIHPDLMLLDVMMPKLNGFEVCKQLRRDPSLDQMPVIMITALNDRDGREKAIEAGADDLLTKPVDPTEVRMRVRGITRLNRYRRLQETQVQFQQIAELSRDGCVLVDEAGAIRYANPEACRMLKLGNGQEAVVGRSLLECLRAEFRTDPEVGVQPWEALLTVGRCIPFRLVRPETDNGPAFWIQVEVMAPRGAAKPPNLVRLVDITDQLTRSRDLWKFHTQLSHKLRTPLVGLVGSLDLLALEPVMTQRSDMRELLDMSRGCLDRLRENVEDILHYIDAPAIGRAGYATVVEEVPAIATATAREAQLQSIDVHLEEETKGLLVRFPSRALRLTLTELFQNARKFHPQNRPSIRVELLSSQGNEIRLRVLDDGLTLSPDRLEKVWLPYYQSEDLPTGEVTGMGLGLPMIASMVREQGGSCSMSNRTDGRGVCVEIRLRVVTEADRAAA